MTISEKEIWNFLHAIEGGAIELTPAVEPQEVYSANVTYSASNGWKITVFNDCNQFDYIAEIVSVDGHRVTYDDFCETLPELEKYAPAPELAWSRYGIPGHMTFRCPGCDLKFGRLEELQKHRLTCDLAEDDAD